MTTFDPIGSPVDSFVVGGMTSPGVSELDGVSLSRQIDERKGFGSIGAYTVVKGQKLAKFSASITLTTSEEFAEWESFIDVLRRFNPRADRIRGLSFSHPQTDQLGIQSVTVEEISSPKQADDMGRWVGVIKFVEHRRPSPMLASTNGNDSGASSPDPVDRQIEALTRTLNQLSGGG